MTSVLNWVADVGRCRFRDPERPGKGVRKARRLLRVVVAVAVGSFPPSSCVDVRTR